MSDPSTSSPSKRKLTARQREVLQLAGRGYSSKEIAQKLFVSPRTVEFHLGNIYTLFDVGNRIGALNVARGYNQIQTIER